MRLLLVDGTNVVMRYAHAMLPDLAKTPDHPQCHADTPKIMAAVEKAIRECAVNAAGAHHVVVALDSVESWRKREYPSYKATRVGVTGMWTNRLSAHLHEKGIVTARAMDFEADDIIASLAFRAQKAGLPTAVLSQDSDLLVLTSLFCNVFQFGRKNEPRYVHRNLEWVRAKYDIASARHLTAYKALVGEPGDNLPGVEGIGKVKAAKLLQQHGTIENVMASGALSVEQVERVTLMLRLVTLREDVPLDALNMNLCRLTTSITEP